MNRDYLIAVCDILGFSNLVENNPLEVVVDKSLGWFRKSLHHSVHKGTFPKATPTLKQLQSDTNVGLAWFSDTILLYTKRDTDEAVRTLLSVVGWLIFETILEGNTKVRCGVSYGPAFVDPDNSLYVGRPIVDAYRLEQRQEWAGGPLTPEAVDRIPPAYRDGHSLEWWLRLER